MDRAVLTSILKCDDDSSMLPAPYATWLPTQNPVQSQIAARTAVLLDRVLRKTVTTANEQFAGTAGVPIPRERKTRSWNDLAPRMPAASSLGDDGDSR